MSTIERSRYEIARKNRNARNIKIMNSLISRLWLVLLIMFLLGASTTSTCCGFLLHANQRQYLFYHIRHPLFMLNQRQDYQSHQSQVSQGGSKSAEISKNELFLILDGIPANAPTPPETTERILRLVRQLEENSWDGEDTGDDNGDRCTGSDDDDILVKLGGTWELLWTTQDRSSNQYNTQEFWKTFINNNPSGRLNPVLPRPIQDQLERMGIISTDDNGDIKNVFRSTQNIDLRKQRVRNVVAFSVPSFSLFGGPPRSSQNRTKSRLQRRASLTVDIDFTPVPSNRRRIDVKFQSRRVVIPETPVDITFPLGLIGPTGWLQTNYIDDEFRITRGHKGSVFVLRRP